MIVKITKILSSSEFLSMCDNAVAEGFYRNDIRILTPGMAWFTDWIYDPTGVRQASGKHVMIRTPDSPNREYLSEYYWSDWSTKFPPICVVCPDGSQWEINRKSSNGPGWKVIGTLPDITCTPSIVVPGYHGWLRDGIFSDNLESRGS